MPAFPGGGRAKSEHTSAGPASARAAPARIPRDAPRGVRSAEGSLSASRPAARAGTPASDAPPEDVHLDAPLGFIVDDATAVAPGGARVRRRRLRGGGVRRAEPRRAESALARVAGVLVEGCHLGIAVARAAPVIAQAPLARTVALNGDFLLTQRVAAHARAPGLVRDAKQTEPHAAVLLRRRRSCACRASRSVGEASTGPRRPSRRVAEEKPLRRSQYRRQGVRSDVPGWIRHGERRARVAVCQRLGRGKAPGDNVVARRVVRVSDERELTRVRRVTTTKDFLC